MQCLIGDAAFRHSGMLHLYGDFSEIRIQLLQESQNAFRASDRLLLRHASTVQTASSEAFVGDVAPRNVQGKTLKTFRQLLRHC